MKTKIAFALFVALANVVALVFALRPLKQAPAAQPHETCASCNHLFKPGTGKHVPFNLGKWGEYTNTYCGDHAPAYDRVATARETPWGSMSGYFVRQSEWRQVGPDGSDLNPHKCPEPCAKCAVNHAAHSAITNVVIGDTNWLWSMGTVTNR